MKKEGKISYNQGKTPYHKLSNSIISQIIALLSENIALNDIARIVHKHVDTVTKVRNENLEYINTIKKQNMEKIVESESSKYRKLIQDCLDKARQTIPFITDDKLKVCSAPQLATTAAIMIDKYNIGVGNATDIIHLTHAGASRQDILNEILSKPKDKVNIIPENKGQPDKDSVKKDDLPSEKEEKEKLT